MATPRLGRPTAPLHLTDPTACRLCAAPPSPLPFSWNDTAAHYTFTPHPPKRICRSSRIHTPSARTTPPLITHSHSTRRNESAAHRAFTPHPPERIRRASRIHTSSAGTNLPRITHSHPIHRNESAAHHAFTLHPPERIRRASRIHTPPTGTNPPLIAHSHPIRLHEDLTESLTAPPLCE